MNFDFTSFFYQQLETIPPDPFGAGWWFFTHGGYLVLLFFMLLTLVVWWKNKIQHDFEHKTKFALLAIDVPKETAQTPLAVESLFSALSGAWSGGTRRERWLQGYWNLPFSFEIVSLGGYTQFLIRTPDHFRDLVEAAVYAQYPTAEITEVHDYVDRIPVHFDDDKYKLWGTEFVLEKKWVYPIRTYIEFEKMLAEEFKDPMAHLLEVMSRIRPEEDVWLQFLIMPIKDDWKVESAHEVKKLVSSEEKGHGLIYWLFIQMPFRVMYDLFEAVIAGIFEPSEAHEAEVKKAKSITDLTPGQKKVVEAIEAKASKTGFLVKFRMVYWGEKEVFVKGRGISAVVGAIKQFSNPTLNGFKPSSLVTTDDKLFLFPHSRLLTKQHSLLRAYKRRNAHHGAGHGFILNIEELATLYHFPILTVKAPFVAKTESKTSEPPIALPMLRPRYVREADSIPGIASASETVAGAVPSNLPFVE